jgi:outer membrane biosynthesis protein TonB
MLRDRLAPLLTALALAAFAAGCGGASEPIPTASAEALIQGIDRVEASVREGECRRTRSTLRRLEKTARELPADVDPELRRTLVGGVENLAELVRTQCKQKRPKPKPKPKPVEPEPEPTYEAPVESEPEPEPSYEPPVREEPQQEPEPQRREEPQDDSSDGDGGSDDGGSGGDDGNGEEPGGDDGGGGGGDPCPPGSSDRC